MPIRGFWELKTSEIKFFSLLSEGGVTLLELILVMSIMGVLALFISDVIFYETDMYVKLTDQTASMQVTRSALQMIARDLRQIMARDSIFWASSDSIWFDDINDVSVSIKFVNHALYRNNDLLIEPVEQFQLRFFDENGSLLVSPVTNRALINSIALSLTTSIGEESCHLETRIQPRTFWNQ